MLDSLDRKEQCKDWQSCRQADRVARSHLLSGCTGLQEAGGSGHVLAGVELERNELVCWMTRGMLPDYRVAGVAVQRSGEKMCDWIALEQGIREQGK